MSNRTKRLHRKCLLGNTIEEYKEKHAFINKYTFGRSDEHINYLVFLTADEEFSLPWRLKDRHLTLTSARASLGVSTIPKSK